MDGATYTLSFSFHPPFIHARFVNRRIGFLFTCTLVFIDIIGTISILFFDKLSSTNLFSPTFTN